MRARLLVAAALFAVSLNALATPAPRTREVELTAFTQLTIDLVPDLGTRLVFPFTLDDASTYIPFQFENTNPSVFPVTEIAKDKTRRDSIVVRFARGALSYNGVGAPPVVLGALYLTAGDYHITILLRGSFDTREVYSDVVFKLTEAARAQLVQQAVEKQVAAMRAQFAEKEAGLAAQAKQMALNKLALIAVREPARANIYEAARAEVGGGELELEVQDMLDFGEFRTYRMELTWRGNEPIRVQGLQLFARGAQIGDRVIPSAATYAKTLDPGQPIQLILSTDAVDLCRKAEGFEVAAATTAGPVNVKW